MWRRVCNLVDFLITDIVFKLSDNTGGGSDPQPAQIIPAPQAPNYQQTAEEVAKSQLTYNPQLAAQNVQIQGTQGPILAQQQYDLSAQYGPMYRALIEQQFPQIGMLSNQVSQGLASPRSLTVEQQAAQDAIRQRAYDASAKGIRESANVGGTLYGGRRELREDRARNELAQGFATEDINRQMQQRQQSMSELAMLFQLAFPNVQQPGQIGLNTGVSDPTSSLYNALVQNSGNFGIIPGTAGSPSPFWDLAGKGIGAAGTYAGLAKMCHVAETLYGINDFRTLLARLYVWTHDSWFLRLYRRHSTVWASWLRRIPVLKPIVQPIWDRMWVTMLVEGR